MSPWILRVFVEGSRAAPSLPAPSTPIFGDFGAGWVLGALCGAGCEGNPKTIPHHLVPAPNPSFPTGPELLAFGSLMEEPQETQNCSAPKQLQLWGPSCRFGVGPAGFGVGVSPCQPCSLPELPQIPGCLWNAGCAQHLGKLELGHPWGWTPRVGTRRCPHVTPHGWPCQMPPQEPFCTSWGFSRNSEEEEEAAGASLTQTPFAPRRTLIPKALELWEEPHPRIFCPGSKPPGDCVWCKSSTSLGSFPVLTLLPNFFPFLSPCLMDTPGKGPFPTPPMGAFALGVNPGLFSSKIHAICLP